MTVRLGIQRLVDGQQAIRVDVLGIREEVRLLKEYQRTQNGSVTELREDHIILKATIEERERNNRTWMTVGLAAAGVLSGVIFGVLRAAGI